jgi:hypothetical protein
MAKFKYLRGGRVFESDKVYNLPTVGPDGKLVTPSKTIDPNKPPVKKTPITPGPKYIPINPKSTPAQNKVKAQTNLSTAVRFKNMLTGVNKNLAPIDMHTKFVDGAPINTSQNARTGYTQMTGFEEFSPQTINQADSVINASRNYLGIKKKFDTGGIVESKKKRPFDSILGINDPMSNGRSTTISSAPTQNFSQPSSGGDWQSAAPFFDNFANLVATSKTPKIPEPVYTQGPRLNTEMNINPQKRRIENEAKALSMGIDQSTSSAGVANANKGKLMADKWRAYGDLEANKFNTETQLKNQQSMADYENRRSNDALSNQRNTMQMMRTDDVNSRYAAVVSDFGNDIANINREKNLQSRDKEALKMLMKVNPDSAYQFADTESFATLYKNDEPGLTKLIKSQKGTETKAALIKLYNKLYSKQYVD